MGLGLRTRCVKIVSVGYCKLCSCKCSSREISSSQDVTRFRRGSNFPAIKNFGVSESELESVSLEASSSLSDPSISSSSLELDVSSAVFQLLLCCQEEKQLDILGV